MSIYRDLDTQVRINPETYIKFDGSEFLLMKNIHSEDGVSIKYDIMLILYSMINWTTVGELIKDWPPDDQEKIMDHLEMMASKSIVVTQDSDVQEVSESGLSAHLGTGIHINVENHHNMLRDYVRMAAYRRAIEKAVTPDTIAMDLGCGSGILGFFAAAAGAKKVIAIEKRPDILMLAKELAKANGLEEKMDFHEGSSSHIKEDRIDPKPNLFISEILGNGILEENILEFTIDARERFLAPGAAMIPAKLDIYFFGFDSGYRQSRWEEVQELKDLYGFDFEIMGQVLCSKATTRMDRYNTLVNKQMSDSVMVRSIDFLTVTDPVFSDTFELIAKEDGELTSFCGYFKAHLDADTILTNSPWAPATHWTQLIYTLAAPRPVKKGEAIQMEIIYDGALRVKPVD